MNLGEIIGAITAVFIGLPTFVGAVMWITNLQTRLKHAEERIGDLKGWMEKTEAALKPLGSLPEVLKGLGKDIAHGLEMVGLEMKAINDRFEEHTGQDEKRFTTLDEKHESLSRQIGHIVTGGNDSIIEIRRVENEPRRRKARP